MKKLLIALFVGFLFLTSCVTQKKAANFIERSSPTNSKVYGNVDNKNDFIIVTKDGVKRVETGGTFSAKIKKEYIYNEVK